MVMDLMWMSIVTILIQPFSPGLQRYSTMVLTKIVMVRIHSVVHVRPMKLWIAMGIVPQLTGSETTIVMTVPIHTKAIRLT